jgi:hypothetical protein
LHPLQRPPRVTREVAAGRHQDTERKKEETKIPPTRESVTVHAWSQYIREPVAR